VGGARAGSRYPLGLMSPRPRPEGRGFPVVLGLVATVELTPLTDVRCARTIASESVYEARWRALPQALRSSALPKSPERVPAPSLQRSAAGRGACIRCFAIAPTMDSAGGRQAVGRFRGAEAHRLCGSKRSEPRKQTHCRLFEHSERSERSEFDSGHKAEHCREPSAQPRAPVNEPRRLPAPGRTATHDKQQPRSTTHV